VYIDNKKNNDPILFDPGADTVMLGGGEHPNNDVFHIAQDQMTLSEYVKESVQKGQAVEFITFDTTPEEEAAIAKNIHDLTGNEGEGKGVSPGRCAKAVSQVLNGVGPFKNLGSFARPAALARYLRSLKANPR
jgi:hypothetical protein